MQECLNPTKDAIVAIHGNTFVDFPNLWDAFSVQDILMFHPKIVENEVSDLLVAHINMYYTHSPFVGNPSGTNSRGEAKSVSYGYTCHPGSNMNNDKTKKSITTR